MRFFSIVPVLLLGAWLASAPARAAEPVPPPPTAPAQTTELSGWFKPMPFHRIIDVELTFPGFPDVLGLCVQGEPTWYISIEGCAGTFVFINSLSLDVRARFIHYMNLQETRRADGKIDYHGWEFGLGPSLGVRDELLVVFLIIPLATTTAAIDAELSAEAVYWFSKYVGFKMQVDVGATIAPSVGGPDHPTTLTLPVVELKLGVAF